MYLTQKQAVKEGETHETKGKLQRDRAKFNYITSYIKCKCTKHSNQQADSAEPSCIKKQISYTQLYAMCKR